MRGRGRPGGYEGKDELGGGAVRFQERDAGQAVDDSIQPVFQI